MQCTNENVILKTRTLGTRVVPSVKTQEQQYEMQTSMGTTVRTAQTGTETTVGVAAAAGVGTTADAAPSPVNVMSPSVGGWGAAETDRRIPATSVVPVTRP